MSTPNAPTPLIDKKEELPLSTETGAYPPALDPRKSKEEGEGPNPPSDDGNPF